MRAIILAVTLVVFTLAVVGVAQSQTPDPIPPVPESTDPVIRTYRDKLPLLIERYSTNRKIRFRLTKYAPVAKGSLKVGDEVSKGLVELITDGQQMKAVTLESTPERFKGVVQFWRPDMRFNVTKQADKYKITEQNLASTNYSNHESEKYNFYAHEPMRAGDSSGSTLWFDARGRDYVIFSVTDVKSLIRDGKDCAEILSRWDNRHGMVQLASTFLDPANDYVTVATETDWKTEPAVGDYKAIREVEYQMSAEGVLLPKWSRTSVKNRAGVALKVSDVEFLSYERYVPSADEFLLEKEYGLVTPAVIPTAANPALTPPSRRWRAWPWAVVAAGAALAVAAVGLYRRSRRPAVA